MLLGFSIVSTAVAADRCDVVVYGGTSGGVVAAVQVARMGHSVVLVEPGRHLGGLTSGGLGATDIGNKQAIGGLAREFYHRIFLHYQQPNAWKYESLAEYGGREKGHWIDADTMWGFEPHVAEQVYRAMAAEAHVPIVFGERLDLRHGVRKDGPRIAAVVMESGRAFAGRVFIDATYEGDLMAQAGVASTVGREANAAYGETLDGVQTRHALASVRPGRRSLLRPGDPASGLLPGVHGGASRREGQADRRVQAYSFRMCTDRRRRKSPRLAQTRGLRSAALRVAAAVLRGRRWTDSLEPGADAQPQDRHQQQRRLLHRQHRHELRLPRGRLRHAGSDHPPSIAAISRA